MTVKDMYHEQQHVWQNTRAWNDRSGLKSVKGYKQTTDIVRRLFISQYFPSAYYNNYSNDPSEMDAERNGIKCALIYFESDPIISKTEAEEILFQFTMSDDYVHREILDGHRNEIRSIYDIIAFFDEYTKTATDIKYPITKDILEDFKNEQDIDMALTHDFLYSEKYKEYRKAFDKCETGTEQDKVLEQVILFTYPDIIKKAPLRLQEELLDCRRQMELDTIKPGIHAINPKHIKYSVNPTQEADDIIELTDEDVAAIPMNNDNMTR